jgi:hypothetical protein
MTNRLTKSILALAICLLPCFARAQMNLGHGFPTNCLVTSTATNWQVPPNWNYGAIRFTNDGGTNVYECDSGAGEFFTITTNLLFNPPLLNTNGVNVIAVTSSNIVITNTVPVLVAGQGTRLNANGGYIIFNSTGRPQTRYFQFITQGATTTNNVSIQVNTLQ